MMDYACPVWRHAADNHLKKLQHVQVQMLAYYFGAPLYVSNLQLHEDLEVPYIAEHIRNIAKQEKCNGMDISLELIIVVG